MNCNVNGIRAASQKGFLSWIAAQQIDIFCLQEIKASQEQTQAVLSQLPQYHCYSKSAVKKGYSGVALCSLKPPKEIIQHLDWLDMDEEGRYIEARFDDLIVVSLYLPSGTSGEERQNIKYKIMERFFPHIESLLGISKNVIITGDWNIAHNIIDIKNWKANQKNSGFLPEERAWLDKIFDSGLYADAFRIVNQEQGQYTWWTYRGQAWANNVGWRIDYQIISQALTTKVTDAFIYKEKRFSDHAPLILDYNFTI